MNAHAGAAPRVLRSWRAPGSVRAAVRVVLWVILSVAASAAAGGSVQAAGSGRAASSQERLRLQGEAALLAKDYDAAARAFTDYYRQTRQPEGLYQLGIVAQAQGRLLDAQDLLRRFLSDPRTELQASAEQQAEARRILALARPPSGKVNIIGSSGALVYLDDRLIGSLPLARPLLAAPGKHTLRLEDGAQSQQEEIDAGLGRFLEITYDKSTRALLSTELPGVLMLESYSGLPDADAQKLSQAVEDAVQRERLSPFPAALALERGGAGPTSGCLEVPACLCQLAQKSELEFVLQVSVTQRPGLPWQLRLELLDSEVQDSAARTAVECPACDATKAAAALHAALPELLGKARQRPRAELKVTSTPPGAVVQSEGRRLGTTPLGRPVWAGELQLELSLSGYKTQRVAVTAAEGKPAELAVVLEPEPPAPPPPVLPQPERPRYVARPAWRLGLGGAALGLGVLLGGFGISALAVEGTCLPGTPPTAETCRQLFATSAIGGGLVATGVAAEVTGILLLAIPSRRSP